MANPKWHLNTFSTATVVACAMAAISGCGGSDEAAAPPASSRDRMTALAASPQAAEPVVTLSKVSEVRIDRTTYDYVFRVTVSNGSAAKINSVASIASVGQGTKVIDGTVEIGELPSGITVLPADTITLRQDRLLPFNAGAIKWTISGDPAVSGRVADGYLSGATVFWDCNGNFVPDAAEKISTTKAGGLFILPSQPDSTCDLVAKINVGAIDSDSPFLPVTTSYTLFAAPDQFSFISPLTTFVGTIIKTGKATNVVDASNQVTRLLQLPLDPSVDYMATITPATTQQHLAAALAARLLSTTQGSNPLAVAGSTLAILSDKISDTGLTETLKIGVDPYVYIPRCQRFCLDLPPIENGLNKAWVVPPPPVAYKDLFERIAKYVNDGNYARFGAIAWADIPTAQIHLWATELDTITKSAGYPNVTSAVSDRLIALREKRMAEDRKLAVWLSESMAKATDATTVFPADVGLFVDAASVMVEGTSDAISLFTRIPSLNTFTPPRSLTALRGALPEIGKAISLVDKGAKGTACMSHLEGLTNDLAGSQKEEVIQNGFLGCIGLFADAIGTIGNAKKHRGDTSLAFMAVMKDAINLQSDIFVKTGVDPAQAWRIYGKNFVTVYDFVIDTMKMTGLTPALTTRPYFAVDYGVQLLKGALVGSNIADVASKNKDAKIGAILYQYSYELDLSRKEFELAYMYMFDGAFYVGTSPPSTPATTTAFRDDFNGSALLGVNWTLNGTGAVTLTNGVADFSCSASISTEKKATFSGTKIVIQARFNGTGQVLQGGGGWWTPYWYKPLRETLVTLVDATTGDSITFGDASPDLGWFQFLGLHTSGTGAFNMSAVGNGSTIGTFNEYRLTLDGASLKLERGATLSNVTETLTRTMPTSIGGRTFYLIAKVGGGRYCPGSYDWVQVNTY